MIALLIIIGLSLLILIHEFGHFIVAKLCGIRVEEFGFGFPPRLFTRRFGETLYSINLLPFGGFVRMEEELGAEEGAPLSPRSFARKPYWQQALVIVAGVVMNVFFGWILFVGVFLSGTPQHLAVVDVVSGSPADAAGVRSGDIVMEAAFGEVALQDPIALDAFIALVEQAGEHELSLSVLQEGGSHAVALRGRLDPPPGQGSLGVSLTEIGISSLGFFGSLKAATLTTIRMTGFIAQGIFSFFRELFSGFAIFKSVVGPVGAVSFAAQTGTLGAAYLLQFIAFISLNVALFNLLPFPVLDGGRLLLLVFEKIKGKPLSRRVQAGLNTAGFVLLLGLVVLVTIHDVQRIVFLPGFHFV